MAAKDALEMAKKNKAEIVDFKFSSSLDHFIYIN